MKILVVCQYYAPEPFRISDICEELVRQGHQVTVITGIPNYPEGEIYPGYKKCFNPSVESNGVQIHRCFTVPRKSGAIFRLLNYYSFAWSSSRFLKGLKGEYDVVFVNQLSPVMMAQGAIKYAKKHRKKLVLYCLDLWPESLVAGGIAPNSFLYNFFLKISKKIYAAADQILISSKGFAPYFKEKLNIDKKLIHLPQYAEALFTDIPAQNPHEAPYHLTFAGNIGEIQSLGTVIEAARLLQEDERVVFDIIGDGSDLARCMDAAKNLKNVIFHGRKPLEEMPAYYARSDGMIVSLKDNPIIASTLPGKVQSYMAAGRALIGSIGGEAEWVIKDADCGICAPPENAKLLAEAIRELLDHPEKFITFGENAKKYYEKQFAIPSFFNTLTAILEENSN